MAISEVTRRVHAADVARRVAGATAVLIGESTHGTQEFYAFRADVTKHLIAEHGFRGIAAEADWPDAYRVNRYVRGTADERAADEALGGFRRFPQWMWRNTVMIDMVEWLRERNASVPVRRRAGFYGLDLYSMFASIDAVVRSLQTMHPEAAQRARDRYACFDHVGHDAQRYGFEAAGRAEASCEDEVVAQLLDLRQGSLDAADPDDAFYVEQNALVAVNAERYYREMYRGAVSSWNIRDRHMGETLAALVEHLDGPVVVWAHNSHVGDARHSEMGRQGEVTVGQLARERFGSRAALVGLTTSTGTVTAASWWGGEAERKQVRTPIAGSYERLFHDCGVDRFMLDLHEPGVADVVGGPRLERAIGVIYRPETERASHYFHTLLPRRYDLVVHIEQTRALEPLERTGVWDTSEPPETYPTAV